MPSGKTLSLNFVYILAMGSKVLITGGSGLIGMALSKRLEENSHEVVHLSRMKKAGLPYTTFIWDIDKDFIEEGTFDGVNAVIHLAGANIAEKRWTAKRKKELADSRIMGARLIYDHLSSRRHEVKAFISASAIGIYGYDTGDELITEDHPADSHDFLAILTRQWEATADAFSELKIRVVKLRIGLVLSKEGGLLKKLLPFARLGLSSAFGTGRQFMSWIHIDDLTEIFVMTVSDETVTGAYNAVAPNPVTNREFLKILARTTGMPYFLPNTPKVALRLMLGEMAEAVAGGNRVSCRKIIEAGFRFKYKNLEDALKDLL